MNETKKALECCVNAGNCVDCPLNRSDIGAMCIKQNMINALELINRQKAEIERLTINMNAFGLGMKREKERADTARAEAIKE